MSRRSRTPLFARTDMPKASPVVVRTVPPPKGWPLDQARAQLDAGYALDAVVARTGYTAHQLDPNRLHRG